MERAAPCRKVLHQLMKPDDVYHVCCRFAVRSMGLGN